MLRVFGPRVLIAGIPLVALTAASGQTLLWSDDFSGSSLNLANWEFMIGDGTAYGLPSGWGNNERQYYTDRSENLSVQGGMLHITARFQRFNNSDYTSARIRSRNRQDFLYGRIEARVKLPSGQGIWPAFWMLPSTPTYGGWAASGEIDVLESVNLADTIFGTIHFGGEWPGQVSNGGQLFDGRDFSQGFHVYAIEWRPDEIRWFVDGVQYHSVSSSQWFSTNGSGNPRAPFDQPFHLLLNVAVGGNFPGEPNGSVGFPMEMAVDWVRVYELETQSPFSGTPLVIPGRIEAEDFDLGGQGFAYQDFDASNNGGAYRPSEGVDIEATVPSGFNIGWIRQGEWIEYSVDVTTPGVYRMDARVASAAGAGSFSVALDDQVAGAVIATPLTGGWQSWTVQSTLVALSGGPHVLRLSNLGNDSQGFNLDWLDLTLVGALDDANADGRTDIEDLYSLEDGSALHSDVDADGVPGTQADRAALRQSVRAGELADLTAP